VVTTPPDAGPRATALGCLGWALNAAVLLAAVGLIYVGGSMVGSHLESERRWATVAVAAAVPMAAGALAAVASTLRAHPVARGVATAVLALAATANLVLAGFGLGLVAEAQARGGDWAALQVGTARLFGVALPALLAALCTAALWCHPRARRPAARG
jgi:hypothetical protein